MALLEMKDVTFTTGEITVLNEVSFSIEEGTVTALLGIPGSGKSTALKLLAGLISPSTGKILFNKKDIFTLSQKENLAFRKRTGFMFQNAALWANQDIYHNLELPLQIHFPQMTVEEKNQKIKEITNLVGYHKPLTNRPAALSIGEQKRVGFARALICNPNILFLDEPTESLDEETSELFVSILQKFCDEKNTLIYVSHDSNFIKTFSGNRHIFNNGELIK